MTNHFFRPIPPKSWQVRILSSVKWVKASILLHVSEKRTCIRHVSVKVVEGHPLCYLKLQIVFLCVSAWLAARYRTEFQYLPLFQPSLEEPVLFSFQTGSCYKSSTAALNFVMSSAWAISRVRPKRSSLQFLTLFAAFAAHRSQACSLWKLHRNTMHP